MSTLKRAIEIAKQAHAGQVDKGGADYIEHPLRVMEMCETEEEKIVGILHDVVEDSDWTFEMLEAEGFSDEIVDALRCITRQSDDEDYDAFISRVMTNPLAVKIKLYDLEDNLYLSRLKCITEADLARCEKYKRVRDRLVEEIGKFGTLKFAYFCMD